MNKNMKFFDVIIVGSGLAGLTVALNVAAEKSVGIITKKKLKDGSSSWAQGGIAAVVDKNDSIEAHLADTINVGSNLSNPDVARAIVKNGQMAVAWLTEKGVSFTKSGNDTKDFHLHKEGGHSRRRVLHAADATGKEIQNTLESQVRNHANISILDNHIAIDIITGTKMAFSSNTALGIYALDALNNEIVPIGGSNVVLATGGASKVYTYTSNPDTATGDGIAMGWRAGCTVTNMEFIQFHPTCLYHPKAKSFLISEAFRGEGALLRLPNGDRFMQKYDSRAELAPRDIVARAIDAEIKKRGIECVFLDITHKSNSFLTAHFPNILSKCSELGINITSDPIPVVPAAHYTCGGLKTDINGKTDLSGLFAVGETAYSGLHGANRLASNSLLECVVMGINVAKVILSQHKRGKIDLPAWDSSRVISPDEAVVITHNWHELRKFMWDYVGIVRTNKRLTRALNRIHLLKEEIREYYSQYNVTPDFIELRNLVQTAELIVRSAQLRKESRGLHFSADYPNQLAEPKDTNLTPSLI